MRKVRIVLKCSQNSIARLVVIRRKTDTVTSTTGANTSTQKSTTQETIKEITFRKCRHAYPDN